MAQLSTQSSFEAPCEDKNNNNKTCECSPGIVSALSNSMSHNINSVTHTSVFILC